ncbi:MAG: response regulator [Patescibacteria group bacterium]|nr:MAG: response regulator [Patescibacteria group bacterium]
MPKKNVLLVEDEIVLVKALTSAFLNTDCNLTVAYNGEEASELINKSIPDLILLDLLLPKKNGIELLKEIRASEKTKHIPVVVLSNFNEASQVETLDQLGIKEFITKADADLSQIVKSVEKYL